MLCHGMILAVCWTQVSSVPNNNNNNNNLFSFVRSAAITRRQQQHALPSLLRVASLLSSSSSTSTFFRSSSSVHSTPTLRMASTPSSIDNNNTNNQSISSSSFRGIERPATKEQIMDRATDSGIDLTFSTLGPGFRATARASHEPKLMLGYCEGFLRPGGKIVHVDKLEVWKKSLNRANAENPDKFQKSGGQTFGIGLFLGYLCFLHGIEKGYEVAEFLAIDDEPVQHTRLVRFFRRAGFIPVRYVGEDLSSVPDRLVWGGCGTLMKGTMATMLEKWTTVLFSSK